MSVVNALVTDTFLGIKDQQPSIVLALNLGDNNIVTVTDESGEINPYLILAKLGIVSWERLNSAACRVKIEDNKVVAIGAFLEDSWYELVAEETSDELEEVEATPDLQEK